MSIPATDKISATFPQKYINTFRNGDQFHNALHTIQSGIDAGKIYNQEFKDAKDWIANGCEHAQHVAANGARGGSRSFGDCRDNIGYAFSMNQAAKLSRELKKLQKRSPEKITSGIVEYVATLDQIDAVWKWLQSVKPIIVKGRKPNVVNKTQEQIEAELTNTGHCAICGRRQKLSGEELRTRTMVHHGYQMSDYNHSGYRVGKCFGTARLPYEVSCEANKEFLVILKRELKEYRASLKAYQNSEADTLMVTEYPTGRLRDAVQVPYAKGTTQYEKERQSRIHEKESRIRQTQSAIKYHEAKVADWKPVKLYDEITDAAEKALARLS